VDIALVAMMVEVKSIGKRYDLHPQKNDRRQSSNQEKSAPLRL
jgi:hypothetical protein